MTAARYRAMVRVTGGVLAGAFLLAGFLPALYVVALGVVAGGMVALTLDAALYRVTAWSVET